MKNNKTLRKEIRLTQEEYDMIRNQFEEAGCSNFSEYIRTVSASKVILSLNPEFQKKILLLMGNLTSNMNQIAIAGNMGRTIYKSDIDELKRKVEELCRLLVSILAELQKLKH